MFCYFCFSERPNALCTTPPWWTYRGPSPSPWHPSGECNRLQTSSPSTFLNRYCKLGITLALAASSSEMMSQWIGSMPAYSSSNLVYKHTLAKPLSWGTWQLQISIVVQTLLFQVKGIEIVDDSSGETTKKLTRLLGSCYLRPFLLWFSAPSTNLLAPPTPEPVQESSRFFWEPVLQPDQEEARQLDADAGCRQQRLPAASAAASSGRQRGRLWPGRWELFFRYIHIIWVVRLRLYNSGVLCTPHDQGAIGLKTVHLLNKESSGEMQHWSFSF